jgi:hypothetical protein
MRGLTSALFLYRRLIRVGRLHINDEFLKRRIMQIRFDRAKEEFVYDILTKEECVGLLRLYPSVLNGYIKDRENGFDTDTSPSSY